MVGLVLVLASSGCRFKGGESFASATTPHEPKASYQGDPYSNGGIADATGGAKPETRYGMGAKTGAAAKPNYNYDQPAKGSGQQPGENPGTGVGNAPVQQGKPSEYTTATGRVRG